MYDAAPLQCIAQAIVTIAGGGGPITFVGRGIQQILRDGATGGQGGYFIVLDPGLIGNAGAVPPVGAATLDTVRTVVQPRGAGVPPVSGIGTIAVTYIQSPIVGVGDPIIEVTMETNMLVFADPPAFEIIVFKGLPPS